MDSDNKDRLFLFLGTGLMSVLTLFCIFLWMSFGPGAREVGLALGITLVVLIVNIAFVSTCGSPGALGWDAFSCGWLYLAMPRPCCWASYA